MRLDNTAAAADRLVGMAHFDAVAHKHTGLLQLTVFWIIPLFHFVSFHVILMTHAITRAQLDVTVS